MKGFLLRLTLTDRKILIAAGVVFVIFSYLLYDDSLLNRWSQRTGKVAGVISQSQNDVRQKFNSDIRWNSANQNKQVYFGDSLFTGEGSSAEITLDDKSKLQVKPNSLVVLNQTGDQVSVGLSFGSLSGKLNGKLKIAGMDTEISGKDATFELKKSSSGEMQIIPLSGELRTANGIIKDVSTLSKNGLKQEKYFPPVLQLPSKDFKLVVQHDDERKPTSNKTVELKWTAKNLKKELFDMQLSLQPDFSEIKHQLQTASKKIQTPDLDEGTYFARVREGQSEWSTPVTFTVQYVYPKPRLAAPEVKPLPAPFIMEKPEQMIVSWKAIEGAKKYKVFIDLTKEFSAPKIYETDKTELLLPFKQTGDYHFKVLAVDDEQRDGQSSGSKPLTVISKPVPAPEWAQNEYNFNLNAQNEFKITWPSNPEVVTYELQWSNTPQFEKVKTQQIKQPEVTLKNLDSGVYYIRAKSISANKHQSVWSAPLTLKFNTQSPKLQPVPTYSYLPWDETDLGEAHDFVIKWDENKSASEYNIQIDTSKNFENPKSYNSKSNQFISKINRGGSYFVRVQPISVNNKPLSGFSTPEKLDYIVFKPMQAPEFIEPLPQMTYYYQGVKETPISVSWKKTENTLQYTLQASTDINFSHIIVQEKLATNSVVLKKTLPSGALYWRVRSENQERHSKWSDAQPIIVMSGKPTRLNQENRMPAGFFRPLNPLERKRAPSSINFATPASKNPSAPPAKRWRAL